MITGSKYICHFSPDDKFIDMALGDLDVMPAASRVLVFGSPRPLTYIKDCSVEFVSIKAACSMVSSDDCVGVFFHSLTADCFHVLQAMPAQKLVVWLGWGYDYYDLLLSGSYPRGRYQAETRSLLVGLYGSSYPGMSSGGEVSPALRDVINKVDYIACLDTEYKLIKRHNPWFKPQLFWPWGYGYAEDNGSAQGNDILVGNSASPENNHLDLFKLLAEKVHLVGRKVIVPLVYGDMDYRQVVIEAGEKRWGENFQPLIDFVDKDSYFKKLSTCGYVFMSHSRQQAIGNISSALLSGARVFMNPLSPLHTLLQEKGASVDLIGDTMDVTPLSVSQTLINKAVVLDTWGRDARRRQTIALALLVQRHVEQFTTEALPVAQVGKAQAPAAPFFSVVMPVYNRERYVQEAIESVLQQDESDFELIVVDDGSTDRSVRIVQSIRDHRIRLLQNDHGGGAAARNAGIEAARGEFIVWIDSDDRQAPGALVALRRTIEDCHDADVYYGDLEVFDDSRPGEVWRTQYPDFYGESLIPRLIQGNCLPNPGTAVRRSLYQRYGGYNVSFVRCHDFQMWTRLADSATFKKVDSIVCQWRQHDQSLSSAKTRNFEARVAQDMADRYPPSRLFPDLKGTAKAQSSALWRVSLIIQALGEPALALRAAYRAQALGGSVDQARITELERLAGSRYEPFFTVVVTTFNRPQFLIDALDSLDKQSFRDFEVVLVNDCGEGVEHLLANFLYRINYVRQGRNQGPAAARNAAHRLARAQYLVYLDDDDIFLPDHLQVLATALQQHPGEVVYSDALFIAERVEKGVRHVLNQERRYPHGDYSRERLLVDNYIPVNTFAWPRSVALEVGGFDEDLSGLEDWDFLMRLAARLPFHHLQQETVQVRMRADESLPERRSQQALKDYPALYMELYRRHSDTGSSAVMAGRATLLQRLGVDIEVNRPLPSMQAWLQKRALTPTQKKLVDGRLQVEGVAPHFAVLIVDLQGDSAALACTLASLDSARQNYGRLQALVLTAADDIPKSTTPCEVVAVRPEEWITPLNERLAASSFDWCLLLRAGDELTASGLMMAGLELLTAPDCRAIYCDEMFRQDEQLAAALRPAFNLDYLLSFPAGMARHWLFRREVVVAAGGFDPAFEQAPELELILRLINEGGLDGLGHVAEPLLITAAPALADNEAEQQAILLHLQQRGYSDAAVTSAKPGRYRIDYGHAQSPLVSFLILPGERLENLQRCVESILENTRYPNYELLLIQTPLQADEVGAWLSALASLGEARIRVLPAGQEAMAAQTLLNQAAEQAHGDYLLLLSADTAAISDDWLCELLNHAQRPEVACVGAKLLAADGKIAQASLILGLEGPVGRPYVGEPLDAPGYMQRLQVAQNSGAVGHECLLLAKALFLQLGGLSEDEMPWRYAGVDLCLKARQAGYLTVWTPFSQLMLEPVDSTQGTTAEHDALYARWLSVLARDPAYNPNFSLSQPGGFKLADTALSWRPLSSWKPLPTVLAHPSDNYGSGHYRVIQPFTALQQAGLIEGGVSPGLMHVTDLERYDPDVILLQKQIGDDRFEAMRRMQAFSRALKVYELDDYLPNLPVKSVHRAQMPKDILKSMRRGLSYVDRFVVSTQALAEACGGLHGDIRVIENYLPPAWWKGLASPRSRSGKPRVGWAGGISHTGDLEMIADVVQALADEVDWVFMGMCPEKLRPFVKEIHQGVDILAYPRALAALNLDLAVAPLEENPFNQCKSNLRLLEYGACGFPVVCSDVRSYEGSLPVTRVKNRYRDWADAIRMHVADLDASARAGNDLHQQVMRDWTLEGDNLVAWRRAWLPD